MRTDSVIATALLLVGCPGNAPWEQAPLTHTCSIEQMQKVEKETQWCQENAGYVRSYCYGAAIIRNCERRK